jgi:hypothetical protein
MVATKDTDPTDEWGEDEAPLLPAFDFGKKGEHAFIGEILSVKDTPAEGLDGTVRLVALFTVVTTDGEKFVIWGTGMLSRVLPDLIGQGVVKIEDKGLEQQAGGTSLRVFDVRRRK